MTSSTCPLIHGIRFIPDKSTEANNWRETAPQIIVFTLSFLSRWILSLVSVSSRKSLSLFKTFPSERSKSRKDLDTSKTGAIRLSKTDIHIFMIHCIRNTNANRV